MNKKYVKNEFINIYIPDRIYDYVQSILMNCTLEDPFDNKYCQCCLQKIKKNTCDNNNCLEFGKEYDFNLLTDYYDISNSREYDIQMKLLEFDIEKEDKVILNQYNIYATYNKKEKILYYDIEKPLKYEVKETSLYLTNKNKTLDYAIYYVSDSSKIFGNDDYFETIISYNSYLYVDNLDDLSKTKLYKNTKIWKEKDEYRNKNVSVEMVTNGILNKSVKVNSDIR